MSADNAPGVYLQTAHRSIHMITEARANGEAQTLLMASIANSLLGLLSLGILSELGAEAVNEALAPCAEEGM